MTRWARFERYAGNKTTTTIQFTDRYDACGLPQPGPDSCKECEAMGCFPVYIHKGNTEFKPNDCRPLTDEDNPDYIAAWEAAEREEPCYDGWHFIECPHCGGTTKDPLKVVVANQAVHDYACLMVDISNELKAKILAWNFANIADSDLFNEPGKGRELEPHVTLKYGLIDDDPELFFPEIPDKPIPFTLGQVSRFDTSPDYDVLKIDVTSPTLAALHEKISGKFKNEDSHPEYKPHLTLAYVQKGAAAQLDGNPAFEGVDEQFGTVLFSNKNNDSFKKHLGAKASGWFMPLQYNYKSSYCIDVPIRKAAGMSELSAAIEAAGAQYAVRFFAQHKQELMAQAMSAGLVNDQASDQVYNFVADHLDIDERQFGDYPAADALPTYAKGFYTRLEQLINVCAGEQ